MGGPKYDKFLDDMKESSGEDIHGFSADNGVEVITAGIKGYFTMPYGYTITGWNIIGNKVGGAVIDIWKKAGAIPTVADSITGTTKPTIIAAQYMSSTVLTGWDKTITAGDIVAYNIENATDFNQITFQLYLSRN